MTNDLRKFRVPRLKYNVFPLLRFSQISIKGKMYVMMRTFDLEDDDVKIYATENPSLELPVCTVYDVRAACDTGIRIGYIIESAGDVMVGANYALFKRKNFQIPPADKLGKRDLSVLYNLPFCRVFAHSTEAVCFTLDVDTEMIQKLL